MTPYKFLETHLHDAAIINSKAMSSLGGRISALHEVHDTSVFWNPARRIHYFNTRHISRELRLIFTIMKNTWMNLSCDHYMKAIFHRYCYLQHIGWRLTIINECAEQLPAARRNDYLDTRFASYRPLGLTAAYLTTKAPMKNSLSLELSLYNNYLRCRSGENAIGLRCDTIRLNVYFWAE